MYFIDERTIEVEVEDGKEPIVIERNSKFYPYIQRLIEAEQKLKRMLPRVREENQDYRVDD